jgi:hypothetical protein
MTFDLLELPKLLNDLYAIVEKMETLAPGRKFTPDGHLVGSIGEAVAAYAYDLELLSQSEKQHDAKTPDGRFVQIKMTQGSRIAISYTCDLLLVLQLDRKQGFIEIYNGPGQRVWNVIGEKLTDGLQRQISISQLKQLADGQTPAIPKLKAFPDILPKALEAAGADFLPESSTAQL